MGGDPVNPFQGVEHHARGAGVRVRRRLQGQRAVIEFLERIHGQSRARDVAALGFERGEGGAIDRRSGENRESGMDPRQEIVHEAFREAFGPVHALEEDAAEDFHDGGGIGRRKRQELSIVIENGIRNQTVQMRMKPAGIVAMMESKSENRSLTG